MTGSFLHKEVAYCLIALSFGLLLNAVTEPVVMTLFMRGKVKDFALTVAGAAALNIIGNLFLIPKLGALGASLSAMFAIGTLNIFQYLYARKLQLI